MKFTSRLFLIAFYFFIFFTAYSQGKADEKNNHKKNADTARINQCIRTSRDWLENGFMDSAIHAAVECLKIAELQQDKSIIIKSMFNLAYLYDRGEQYAQALDYYQQCLELLKHHQDKSFEADVYNKTGNVYFYLGDYARALEFHLNSLRIREAMKDNQGIATSYNNIGTLYYKQLVYDQAISYFRKSLALETTNHNKPAIASCYNNIGNVYKDKLLYDTALSYFHKSLSINEEYKNIDEIASTYNNIGIVYEMLGNSDTAFKYYHKSLELHEQSGSTVGTANSCIQLGKFYNNAWDYTKAIEYLQQAEQIARHLRSLDLLEIVTLELSISYENTGDFKKAYEYHLLHSKVLEKINSEEEIKKFTRLEMQYAFDKKQKEQEYIIKRQRLITFFFIFGFILMLIIAFLLLRNYKIKKRDNQLLEQKNQEIEQQKEIAEMQRDQITHQKKEIMDSIHYASRIQNAIMPTDEFRQRILPDHFILMLPRDIVSGDYFWMAQKDHRIFLTAADCTGHGVPGAFMSMLGVAFLNEIISKENIHSCSDILNELREYIIKYLHQTGKEGDSKDGMDMAMVMIDYEKKIIAFSGAYNPLYFIQNDNLIEYKASRMPVAIYLKKEAFITQEIAFSPGDTFYLFSDGFVDQFGGSDGRKYKAKQFKEFLLSIKQYDMTEQKKKLMEQFHQWKGKLDQVDDVLVIGVRL